MNDEVEENETGAKKQEPNPALPDWYLQALVKTVNGQEVEFPITLFVGGNIVSGQLVSGHKYFEGLGSQLKQFFSSSAEDIEEVIKYFTSAGEIYTKQDEEELPPPQYIHLREARVFEPGQQPIPTEGSWWRGRLACVDAFHFGSLGVTESA